jgi:hypothetical protein
MSTAKINIRATIHLPSESYQIAEEIRQLVSLELLDDTVESFGLDDNRLFWSVRDTIFHNTSIKIHNEKNNIWRIA